jgi:hypothetical protein
MSPQSGRPKWLTLVLVLAPLWLIVSAGFAIHRRVTSEAGEHQRPRNQFSRSISAKDIGDDLRKVATWIGERNPSGDGPAKNLTRTAAWIEGLLGPTNTGYVIEKKQGPLQWPILMTKLPGKDPNKSAVWVITTYDSKAGSNGIEANATGLVASIAAARALAGSDVAADIHFVFLPHFNDLNAPHIETAALLKNLIAENPAPKAVLCVEAMGAQAALLASSRDAMLLANLPLHDLATAVASDPACLDDDNDLASVLFEMGLPAARIATRPPLASDEPDNRMPVESTIAQSAIHLTELIKRCVNAR